MTRKLPSSISFKVNTDESQRVQDLKHFHGYTAKEIFLRGLKELEKPSLDIAHG